MVNMFLVTANVGSVFDNLEKGMPLWLTEFQSVVRSRKPEFVAIHFQEIGGKNCVTASSIELFFRQLILRMEAINFTLAEAFVDSQSELEEHFTALSSIYFVHESLRVPVHIWDFQDAKFHEISCSPSSGCPTSYKNLHIGPFLDQTHRKQKEKFPQDYYPNCKWSRKGFLRTRWRLGKTVVDLVNIHLFHDSCNLVAASAFPSPFAQHREKTLKYTLDRIQSDDLENSPLFIFGDFNFRINAYGVMEILRKDFPATDSECQVVLGTKRFHCPEHELRFKHSYEWLKQHDFESKKFSDLLHENDLNFHPTYPFEEDVGEPEKFLKTRLPAWCDRVLFTPSTRNAVAKDFPIDYTLIGSKICMGDHKPVCLSLKLTTDPPITLNSNQASSPPSQNSVTGKSRNKIPYFTNSLSSKIPNFNVATHSNADALVNLPEKSNLEAKNSNFQADTGNGSISSENFQAVVSADQTLESGPESPTKFGCFGLFPRGKMRFPKGGGGAGNGGAFGLASRGLKKLKRGTSDSLLEPIASAACDLSCSSLPSSCASSQRPSISIPNETADEQNAQENNVDYFTAPMPPPTQMITAKWGALNNKDCWSCTSTCGTSQIGEIPEQLPVSEVNYAINHGHHCNHLLMNLTQNYNPVVVGDTTINKIPKVGAKNLSLIALNANSSLGKEAIDSRIDECCSGGANGKIPVCWSNYSNCSNNCSVMNSKNSHNSSFPNNQNIDKITNSKGGGNHVLPLNFRNRSVSQGSLSHPKCKCHYKEQITRTGGCVSCSKCVIL